MRYRDISLDELEEIEQELHLRVESDIELLNYTKIEIYDAMLSHLSGLCKEDNDYLDYYTYIKEKLVCYLLRYESNIYDSSAEERFKAEKRLMRVLNYDHKNPIASYKLGCLFYLQKQFIEASSYFQNALDFHKECSNKMFQLNTMQISRAVLYISNCSLHTACHALMINSEHGYQELQLNSTFSGFFTQLSSNEGLLKSNAYRKMSMDGMDFSSVEDSLEIPEFLPKDTISLVFTNALAELSYNGIKEYLNGPQAHVLRLLLLNAYKKAVTPFCLKDYFLDSHVIGGASRNAIEPIMASLKKILSELETQITLKETEEGYRLIGSVEYVLMDRIDEQLAE